jgi:hypothetical protein
MLHEPNQYAAYGQGFQFADTPLHARRNKSGSATHKTTISDPGDCRTFECLVEYSCKHTPALDNYEIEVGCCIAVYSVTLHYRENGREGSVDDIVHFNERLAMRHCDFLLNEHGDIEDRIAEEIRLTLT